MKKCPNCGAMIDDDSLFCSSCGTKLEKADSETPKTGDPPKRCPYCGTPIEEGASYCIECGMRIDGQGASADYLQQAGTAVSALGQGLAVVGAALASLFGPIVDRFLPPTARKKLARYFYGTTLPRIFLIPAIIFFVISLYTGRLIIVPIIFALAAIIAKLMNVFGYRYGMEAVYDQAISEDLANVNQRAYEFLRIDPEQTKKVDPVFLIGPSFENPPHIGKRRYFRYWPMQVYRYGVDGKLRYSVIKVSAYFFTDEQLLVYNQIYDPVTGRVFLEQSKDYFYKDLNVVKIGEEVRAAGLGGGRHMQSYLTFTVTSRSKTKEIGVSDRTDGVQESLRGMTSLIRERRNNIA